AGIVFHLAGLLKAVRNDDFVRVNAGGVESVAAACDERAEPPVFVVVSSLAAAGPCAVDRPRAESDLPTPVSAYGRSKLAAELAATKYAARVPISIVRPPIVFGDGDRAVLELFRPIARWGIHIVPGLRQRRFSLIHVTDVVGCKN
ncbi:MAG TPA: NAD-dependent epimerase/dehydratase family protein, partial [Methylococcales bacterium]